MLTGSDDLTFPVPWASAPHQSALSRPETYQAQLADVGFVSDSYLDRRAFALEFFDALKQKMAASGPPPLGLHLLMGATAQQKIQNMIENLQLGRVAPVELLAQKPA